MSQPKSYEEILNDLIEQGRLMTKTSTGTSSGNPQLPGILLPSTPHLPVVVPHAPDWLRGALDNHSHLGGLRPNVIDTLLSALGIHCPPHIPGLFELPKEKCSACQQEAEIVIKYGKKITRNVCKVCLTKVVDKIVGVAIDAEMEALLYDKPAEK